VQRYRGTRPGGSSVKRCLLDKRDETDTTGTDKRCGSGQAPKSRQWGNLAARCSLGLRALQMLQSPSDCDRLPQVSSARGPGRSRGLWLGLAAAGRRKDISHPSNFSITAIVWKSTNIPYDVSPFGKCATISRYDAHSSRKDMAEFAQTPGALRQEDAEWRSVLRSQHLSQILSFGPLGRSLDNLRGPSKILCRSRNNISMQHPVDRRH
jgi:hypothetical protein